MLKAGTARRIINNELGTDIQAAGHMKKVQRIHDDLEANALWIESDGVGLLFISCDLVGLEMDYVQGLLPDIAEAAGVPRDNIMIGCSHTHSGPSIVGPTHPDKPMDEVYLERLRAWLCTIANEAVSSAEAAEIATSKGHAEIGYNRRVCLTDGAHIMHGDPRRPDATGLEGQNDPQHTVLFIRTREEHSRLCSTTTGTPDLCAAANPLEPITAQQTSEKQTVEIRSPDGSADLYQLLASLAVACRHGFEMKDALDVAKRTYVSVNIHAKDNAAIMDSLEHLPGCCVDSAACLQQQREIYEAHGVFSPVMITGIIEKLKAYDDKHLREELMKKPEQLRMFVEKYFHCG